MSSLEYVSGMTGEVFDLQGGQTLAEALEFRNREWSYSLSARNVYGQSRAPREAKATLHVIDVDGLDRLMTVLDADMVSGLPGTVRASTESGVVWTQRALLVKSEPQSHHRSADAQIDLTFVLLDGVWRHEVTSLFKWHDEDAGAWLDYPHDYPHDYGPMGMVNHVVNPDPLPNPVRFVFYGPCVNPYVVIGGNRYEVDVTVQSGGRVTVDGINDPKTITLTDNYGVESNVFDKGVRGSGRNGGSYIFQPVGAGDNTVNWPGGFDWSITVAQERSEPPWV